MSTHLPRRMASPTPPPPPFSAKISKSVNKRKGRDSWRYRRDGQQFVTTNWSFWNFLGEEGATPLPISTQRVFFYCATARHQSAIPPLLVFSPSSYLGQDASVDNERNAVVYGPMFTTLLIELTEDPLKLKRTRRVLR